MKYIHQNGMLWKFWNWNKLWDGPFFAPRLSKRWKLYFRRQKKRLPFQWRIPSGGFKRIEYWRQCAKRERGQKQTSRGPFHIRQPPIPLSHPFSRNFRHNFKSILLEFDSIETANSWDFIEMKNSWKGNANEWREWKPTATTTTFADCHRPVNACKSFATKKKEMERTQKKNYHKFSSMSSLLILIISAVSSYLQNNRSKIHDEWITIDHFHRIVTGWLGRRIYRMAKCWQGKQTKREKQEKTGERCHEKDIFAEA